MSEATEDEVEGKVAGKPAGKVTVAHIRVDVYAHLDDGMVNFSHVWKEPGGSKKKKGKIEVKDRDTPIHFHLHGLPGLDLAFIDPACDAMWVDLAGCPSGPGDGGQILYPTPPSTNELKVIDTKVGLPCTLHYALRFTGNPTADDSPPYEYDPEIKNV
jgi:hypothetical protein